MGSGWTDDDQERERVNVLVQAGAEVSELRADLSAIRAERDALRQLVSDLYEWLPGFDPGGEDEDDRQLCSLAERVYAIRGWRTPPTEDSRDE